MDEGGGGGEKGLGFSKKHIFRSKNIIFLIYTIDIFFELLQFQKLHLSPNDVMLRKG